MYVEGLSTLICEGERCNDICGTTICTNAPVVSHLQFKDDCFLFFLSWESETVAMNSIFATYEEASRQVINL